jgi:2,4-dienoyl-CoA reductase-like NADH-dependent reductase (Old Yellow Enzyme family)
LDEWGGSLANRARFLLEVIRATRKAIGLEDEFLRIFKFDALVVERPPTTAIDSA